VAESCVATGGSSGAPAFQAADGTLSTNVGWYYTMGYGFTPNKTVVVTALGGFFNGTKTVYLYNRSTGAVLASATVTAANNWAYASIAPVILDRDLPYSIGVDLAGSGAAYRSGMAAMPRYLTDVTINGSCYRASSTAEPCSYSGLISGTNYGMADFKYLPAVGLYQPTDGILYTDVAGDYTAGYAFTPNKNLTVTHLGGLFNGTRTVYLYNRSTGALLASASVPSSNAWIYTRITPITLTAGTPYSVAVYTQGSGASYRGSLAMPTAVADATIDGTCYRPSSTAEPCSSSGLIPGNNYGMADIKYAATGGGLTCPADILIPAGNVCRAATGSCDVSESCTGSSPACPANAFVPAGLACNDGALCTYNDVCNGAGSCGGTAITCGGGNACSTTVCNGTSTCESAKVFCTEPPSECYNTLGSCNTTNGSCSYTVKVGAPCGTRGTCQSSGACYTPPPVTTNSEPEDCASQTLPAPTPVGCDSCDPNHPCVVDTTITVPVEYQTCSGYTPRKGDVVLHEAVGLTQLLVGNFGSNWTHVGVFQDPQPPGPNQAKQMVTHQALMSLEGFSQAVLQPSLYRKALIALSFNKNSAYCKSAKLNPATVLDSGEFLPGVPNTHTADMITEPDGNNLLFWEDGVVNRRVVVAASRAAGESVANQMAAKNDYYSLHSFVDPVTSYNQLSNGKHGSNCASAIMSCITPEVPRTVLLSEKIRQTSERAYEAIRREVRWQKETEDAVTSCKHIFCQPYGYGPCTVDCNGIAWDTANGIADQVIACFLFGPTSAGCDCTRDNRKWHYAAWGGAPPTNLTQDEIDWLYNRLTDIDYPQDPWTGPTIGGQPPLTIYDASSYLPGDVMKSANYPPSNSYYLKKVTNATRKYGHCYAPLSVTGTTSPATATTGTALTWTATASGGIPSSIQFAFFRRRAGGGIADWIPSVNSPMWQTSNQMHWTPSSAEVGTWETYIWVRDGSTPPTMNGYGFAAGYNPGPVQVTGVSQAYPPTGWVDGYNTQHIWGWACDPDYPTQSNRVDVYTMSWQFLGSANAYYGSGSAINNICRGGTAHYFDFYPSGGIPSGTHIMVWSIDLPYSTPGNDNRRIGGSGSIGDGTEFVIP